jgi:ABC-type transporter Mla subunit MlaD
MLAATLETQQVDFDTVRTLHDALGDVATGLEGLAGAFQAEQIRKLGEGLTDTADFLEKVGPAAAKAADDLEKATGALRTDARTLKELLRAAPLDLQAARDIHDSLVRFGEGLDKMKAVLRLERLDAMREGFQGMQSALSTGADQVERLSSYTYPVVTVNGLKPEVTQKPFWPEGEEIAKGLRKAAKGVSAADKEMTDLARDLPRLGVALEDSRKVVDRTRAALALTLKQQEKLEPLLKDMPARAAHLAEELPALGTGLAQVLRDTGKLKEVATGLRQARHSLDTVGSRWPELSKALSRSAKLLKATRTQVDGILQNREHYETAQQQAVFLCESFAQMLPLLTDQLNTQLQGQDQALGELGQGIDEVGDLLPGFGLTVAHLLKVGRFLAWLMAAIFALHGVYLLLSARLGKQFSV